MESIKVENLNFCYPGRCDKALENINFTVNQGDFVLICGKSGCGKTTLLRLLKTSLSPFGDMSGSIYFKGKALSECDTKEQASSIGFVMQNPDNQIVTDKVWHELAFGLESLGLKQNEIRTRVSEMASFFGLQTWFHKNVTELSGGQKQLLNLASVMVMQPSLLILDEPSSQLDPISANEFLNTIRKINRDLGTTIIISEHRLEDVFPMADKVIVMDEGKIIANDTPREIGKILKSHNHDMYKSLPTPVRVHGEVKNSLPCPLTVREGRVWLKEYSEISPLNPDAILKESINYNEEIVIDVTDASFRYEKNSPDVIKNFNLKVHKGELFCLLGGNGSGKTTALSLVSGLNTPYCGNISVKGKPISKTNNLYTFLSVLPQNPQSIFVKKTVYLDLMEILPDNLTKEEKEDKIHKISILCRIKHLSDSHPYDLSGGEQQRVALAKILLTEPEILLLDEPTKGMDALFKEEFADILASLKANGTTILMVSHDIEFCAEYADRCALMFDGNITSVDTPREFFRGKNFYTTSANRMARNHLPDAILSEDIIRACGGSVIKKDKKPYKAESDKSKNKSKKEIIIQKASQQNSESNLFATLMVLLLVPLTIYAGSLLPTDRKYYITSLLIILETMIPFCMMFEKKKPRARELVIISVLCTIAVAGRAAFFMIPEFKPVVAIVIISGICFGGQTGFLVGAISGFVSNFFFGQGPWTPWQMFSFGIIGLIAGALFNKGLLHKNKISLCIFGFLTTFFIYGGIMNPASILMWQNKINGKLLLSAYISGIPLDIIHALSTVIFLWFISEPMIEKLERMKLKYGLIKGL